tara:strand:+ start:34 stop:570 length:537 start_codon:yes stop_codon:yes gene_type:complete
MKKYKWKNRILLIDTPSYKNEDYIKSKKIYEDNIKEFHKFYVKILSNRKKENRFKITLIEFDGSILKEYKKFNVKSMLKLLSKISIIKLKEKYNKLKPQNLSLYSDYNKKTTVPGLGFKNKEKALYTLNKIKNKSLKYQVNLVSTMIGRAKNHPYKNKDMEEAIKIFQKWLDNYNKNK